MKKSSGGGIPIYEPNGDSWDEFLQGLVYDAKARRLDEVKIKGLTNAHDRARIEQGCKNKGPKVTFED